MQIADQSVRPKSCSPNADFSEVEPCVVVTWPLHVQPHLTTQIFVKLHTATYAMCYLGYRKLIAIYLFRIFAR